MLVTPLTPRTRILTFEDDISLLLVITDKEIILCDTHCGPESMQEVLDYLASEDLSHEIVVFNSHSDWDHIWGNSAFPGSNIIAHKYLPGRLHDRGLFDLAENGSSARGEVSLIYPNLLFDTELLLEDADIRFIYAPGHTIDSAICYDEKDRVLFLGDLVEDPIPYLDYEQLDLYIRTLEQILKIPADHLVSGHSGLVSHDLIRSNIRYITQVMNNEPVDTSTFGEYASVHQINLNTLVMFRYEKIVRKILGERFDFSGFWSYPTDLAGISTEELKLRMDEYARSLKQSPGRYLK